MKKCDYHIELLEGKKLICQAKCLQFKTQDCESTEQHCGAFCASALYNCGVALIYTEIQKYYAVGDTLLVLLV